MTQLTAYAQQLLDGPTYAVLATVNRDGSPQTSTMWVTRDGDDVVFSTTASRQKARNLRRDPRVSVMLTDPDNPFRYAEVRGTATLTEEGGPELIQELGHKYTGEPFPEDAPGVVRLVVRVTPTKVVEH